MKTLTKIIRGVLIYWVAFVAMTWAAFFIKGSIPDTLVQYRLGGGAIELIVGGFIEVFKFNARKKYGEEDDEGRDVSDPADDSVSFEQLSDSGDEKPLG